MRRCTPSFSTADVSSFQDDYISTFTAKQVSRHQTGDTAPYDANLALDV
jgi:hypothetical protein